MSAVVVSIAGGQASGKKTVLEALKKRLLELSHDRLCIATMHMSYFSKKPPAQPSRRQSALLIDGTINLIDAEEDDDKKGEEIDREGIGAFDLDALAGALELVLGGDLDPADVGGELSSV